MITLKRDTMTDSYVTYKCMCGRDSVLTYKTIETLYNDKRFNVHNVPVYECSEQHVKLSKATRIKMRNILKNAYENNLDSVEFD